MRLFGVRKSLIFFLVSRLPFSGEYPDWSLRLLSYKGYSIDSCAIRRDRFKGIYMYERVFYFFYSEEYIPFCFLVRM